jgi:hypothetical protein
MHQAKIMQNPGLARFAKKKREAAAGALDSHDILWFKSVSLAKYRELPWKKQARKGGHPVISNR